MKDQQPFFVSEDIELIRADLEPMYDLTAEDTVQLVGELRMVLANTARLLEETDTPWLAQIVTAVIRAILENHEPQRRYNSIVNELANLVAITARVAGQLGNVTMAVDMIEETWEILLDYDGDVAEFVRQVAHSFSEPTAETCALPRKSNNNRSWPTNQVNL